MNAMYERQQKKEETTTVGPTVFQNRWIETGCGMLDGWT